MAHQFIALDFEMANGSPQSVCEIGVALMSTDGTMCKSFESFVRPAPGYDCFDSHRVDVHGIGAEDVQDAEFFPNALGRLEELMEVKLSEVPVFAHGAPLEREVLRSQLGNDLASKIVVLDTVPAARMWMSEVGSVKLDALADVMGSDHFRETWHDSMEDAVMCGNVLNECLRRSGMKPSEFLRHTYFGTTKAHKFWN